MTSRLLWSCLPQFTYTFRTPKTFYTSQILSILLVSAYLETPCNHWECQSRTPMLNVPQKSGLPKHVHALFTPMWGCCQLWPPSHNELVGHKTSAFLRHRKSTNYDKQTASSAGCAPGLQRVRILLNDRYGNMVAAGSNVLPLSHVAIPANQAQKQAVDHHLSVHWGNALPREALALPAPLNEFAHILATGKRASQKANVAAKTHASCTRSCTRKRKKKKKRAEEKQARSRSLRIRAFVEEGNSRMPGSSYAAPPLGSPLLLSPLYFFQRNQ